MPHNDLVCDGWQDADPASDERHVPPPYVDFSSSGFDGTEASEWGDGWAVETGGSGININAPGHQSECADQLGDILEDDQGNVYSCAEAAHLCDQLGLAEQCPKSCGLCDDSERFVDEEAHNFDASDYISQMQSADIPGEDYYYHEEF